MLFLVGDDDDDDDDDDHDDDDDDDDGDSRYEDSSHDHDDHDHFDNDVVSGCYVACLSFDYLASHVITCHHVCATGQDTACLCGDKVADGLRSQS